MGWGILLRPDWRFFPLIVGNLRLPLKLFFDEENYFINCCCYFTFFIRNKSLEKCKPHNPDRLQPVTANKSGYPDKSKKPKETKGPIFLHIVMFNSFDFNKNFAC